MEKKRTVDIASESGIALVMALILTLVMLLLIVSVSYLFTAGFRGNVINRQLSTVYEAANAGVEHSSGIINNYMKNITPTNSTVGIISPSEPTLSGIVMTCATGTAGVKAQTADGKYKIETTIGCLGTEPIPGYGGALRFPPPPAALGGGTGTMATTYRFYSATARAEESTNSENIGQTDAVYRALQ